MSTTEKGNGGKGKKADTTPTGRARARARDKFIAELERTGNVSEACRRAAVDRTTAYAWLHADTAFAKRWDNALEIATDALEAEARRRGKDGVLDPVYQGGKKVGEIRRYSDRMLEILLKGHRARVFGDRLAVDARTTVVNPMEADTKAGMMDLARRMAFILAQGARGEKQEAAPAANTAPPRQPARAPVALLPAPEERRFRVVDPWRQEQEVNPRASRTVNPASAQQGKTSAASSEDGGSPAAEYETGTEAEGREKPPPFVPGSEEMGR